MNPMISSTEYDQRREEDIRKRNVMKNSTNRSYTVRDTRKIKHKRAAQLIAIPGKSIVLPAELSAKERFFISLLIARALDILESEFLNDATLWKTACKRADLPIVQEHIKPMYDNPKDHFESRAALILEEARAKIAQPLQSFWKSPYTGVPKEKLQHAGMFLSSAVARCDSDNMIKVDFFKDNGEPDIGELDNREPFLPEEIKEIKTGTVFQCIQYRRGPKPATIEDVIVGVVLFANQEEISRTNSFSCFFFRKQIVQQFDFRNCKWILVPLCTLITEMRCFEALHLCAHTSVPFLPALLGMEGRPVSKNKNGKHLKVEDVKSTHLNASQQKAASSFLTSDPGTITLIQGPPGTGKTTLLVSVICSYLSKGLSPGQHHHRLMVCAPTNKGIAVLAALTLQEIKKQGLNGISTALVGDKEKLLCDENGTSTDTSGKKSLTSIHSSTWMKIVMDEYKQIKSLVYNKFQDDKNISAAQKLSAQLEQKLKNILPLLSETKSSLPAEISSHLMHITGSNGFNAIASKIDMLMNALNELPKTQVDKKLLTSADVIFCTLSSSGCSTLTNLAKPEIDDLIIDEAAAASEPELYIPFQFKPSRLLAVGDPKQLPATLFSGRAKELGLGKSLHERLMYDCKAEHVMLNIQYRMSPAISYFPSREFYNSEISDGPNVKGTCYINGPRLLDCHPYTFLHVDGEEKRSKEGSYKNKREAKRIVELVRSLRDMATSTEEKRTWHLSARIRIITFYEAQVTLIKERLRRKGLHGKVAVATVDASQGCESEIVVISFVRTGKTAGFVNDARRLNVALTRAKFQLVCVGNVHSFRQMHRATIMHDMAQDAYERNLICSLKGKLKDNKKRCKATEHINYGSRKKPRC